MCLSTLLRRTLVSIALTLSLAPAITRAQENPLVLSCEHQGVLVF